MNLASGIGVWRVVAPFPGASKLIFLVWLEHVANVERGAARVLEVLGSNDLLPFEVVAVRRPIVVTSTRWNHVSLGVLGRSEQRCGASPLRTFCKCQGRPRPAG